MLSTFIIQDQSSVDSVPGALDRLGVPSAWQVFFQATLDAPGYYSVLPRAILNGDEPFTTLFHQAIQPEGLSSVLIEHHRHGRPPGSGTYPTPGALLNAIAPIVSQLRQEGHHPSQERVAIALTRTSDPARQMRKWLRQHNLAWADVLRQC